MKSTFILVEKALCPITVLCWVLGVSPSGFDAWRMRPHAARVRADARLAAQVAAVHERNRKAYGSPRIHAELRAKGTRVGKKRVARLMREHGLEARRKRRFRKTTEELSQNRLFALAPGGLTRGILLYFAGSGRGRKPLRSDFATALDSNHSQPIAPNVLARQFDVSPPNRSWVTDVTAIWTLEGWLLLAAMIDLYSRRVVAWAVGANDDTLLALDALRKGLRLRRPAAGLVHHSDRASPYASADYRAELARHGLVASMSRKGDCWDDAVAESFSATLRAELVDHEQYATHVLATASIGDCIDNFYNVERRNSHLGYINPIEFELGSTTARAAA